MNELTRAVGWRKSTRSGGNAACVELAALPGGHRGVRDSKLRDASPVLAVPAGSLGILLADIKAGRLD